MQCKLKTGSPLFLRWSTRCSWATTCRKDNTGETQIVRNAKLGELLIDEHRASHMINITVVTGLPVQTLWGKECESDQPAWSRLAFNQAYYQAWSPAGGLWEVDPTPESIRRTRSSACPSSKPLTPSQVAFHIELLNLWRLSTNRKSID